MVIIIGGGITGLSLAYFLSLDGLEVTVIEREKQLGGNASWTRLGEFVVGKFYHVCTAQDDYFLDLLRQIDIQKHMRAVNCRMGFYQDDRLCSISTPREFLSFPAISLSERVHLGVLIARSLLIRDWRYLDNKTAVNWLSKWSGAGAYDKVWKPLMNSKFGPAYKDVVATDMWFRINRIVNLRRRRSAQGAFCLKGGVKVFFDALESLLIRRGVRIIKGTAVSRIRIKDGALAAITLANQQEFECKTAISTLSLPDFKSVLPPEELTVAQGLDNIRYLDNICLVMRLSQRFSPFYQLNIGELNFPFTGIIGADVLYPPEDLKGGYLLYVSKYMADFDQTWWQMDADMLINSYILYLKRICPAFDKEWILDAVVTRKRNVEPLHTLHYSKMIPAFTSTVKGLHLLCTAQIYPDATVLDASVKYARHFVNNFNADK